VVSGVVCRDALDFAMQRLFLHCILEPYFREAKRALTHIFVTQPDFREAAERAQSRSIAFEADL
jgi:hypothetical protein